MAMDLLSPLIDGNDEAVYLAVSRFYSVTLREHEKAKEYLASRCLGSCSTPNEFGLGFSNRELGKQLPARTRKAGKQARDRLTGLGLMRESGHEALRGSLTVPLYSAGGSLVAIYGRKITPNLRSGTTLHVVVGASLPEIVFLGGDVGGDDLVLVEGPFDALAFRLAGVPNVGMVMGKPPTSSVETRSKRVFLAFDRDEQGDELAKEWTKALRAQGCEVFRVLMPRGMDPVDVAKAFPPASDTLVSMLRQASWLGGERAPEARTPPVKKPPPIVSVEVEELGDDLLFGFGDRNWRVRGFELQEKPNKMHVNLMVRKGEWFHVDAFDLYAARHRRGFLAFAADELGVEERTLKKDLGNIILALEERRDGFLRDEETKEPEGPKVVDEVRALELLRDPSLLERVTADLDALGLVGEGSNKLLAYLALTSRLLPKPLALVVRSSSAAGKSALLDGVSQLFPAEAQRNFSALTTQALFYLGAEDLPHSILSVSEEEGASRASYALKLLQSQGSLTIASTARDPGTGKMRTQSYRVQGPVMLATTTTALDLDPELLNRALVLTVDEGREQTKAIHARQRTRRTLDGLMADEAGETIRQTHQDAQRLLRPLRVVNPYAERLSFPDGRTRARRDQEKYLSLIDAVALLHQHQREVKAVRVRGEEVEYVEVEPKDIEVVDALIGDVLGQGIDDLPPQTLAVLKCASQLVSVKAEVLGVGIAEVRFTRAELLEHVGMGRTQLWVHLRRLVAHEYLLASNRGRGKVQSFELVSADAATMMSIRGEGAELPGGIRAVVGGDSGASSSPEYGAEMAVQALPGQCSTEVSGAAGDETQGGP